MLGRHKKKSPENWPRPFAGGYTEKFDKKSLELLLEKLVDDLDLLATDYYMNNCINWKLYLYNDRKQKDKSIKKNFYNKSKQICLKKIK